MSEGIGTVKELYNSGDTVTEGSPVYTEAFPLGQSECSIQAIATGDGTIEYDLDIEVTNDEDKDVWVSAPAASITETGTEPLSDGVALETVWAFFRVKVNKFSQSSGTNKNLKILLCR